MATPSSYPQSTRRKILIIDDEDDIRAVIAVALEVIAGWRVVQASSGLEGITDAQRELPDAILLDMQMPGISGPETLICLQRLQGLAAIPVVFLTARVGAEEQRRLLAIGATAVLPKPFDPLTLAQELSSALKWNTHEDACRRPSSGATK